MRLYTSSIPGSQLGRLPLLCSSLPRSHSPVSLFHCPYTQQPQAALASVQQRSSWSPCRSFPAPLTSLIAACSSRQRNEEPSSQRSTSPQARVRSGSLRLSYRGPQQLRQQITRAPRSFQVFAMVHAPGPGAEPLVAGLPEGFSNRDLERFSIGIVGDLHLEPQQMPRFNAAAQQLTAAVGESGEGARLVQLGDLGGYDYQPGSRACFQVAAEYLRQFSMPHALVVGNHDLEGEEFETDEENLAAWTQAFGQRHFWSAELGSVLCLGMSTTRFRSNNYSSHEVHIDDEQIAWFRSMLKHAAGRPIIVFTHAPPLGCGLKAVEGVHVKNRCSWLNHSSNPEIFIEIVREHPNIKLWFSGHYHLSQDYPNSIGVASGCAFVQTNVIGECDRDGIHQSRILQGDKDGYKLFTINHESGELRLDLAHSWHDSSPPRVQWLHSNEGNGTANGQGGSAASMQWPKELLFHQTRCASQVPESSEGSSTGSDDSEWWGAGPNCVLRRMGPLIIEYDAALRAPIGAVLNTVGSTEEVVLVDGRGNDVLSKANPSRDPIEDGSSAVAVETRNISSGKVLRRVERNEQGGFFQIFQHNKWRLRKERELVAQAS